MPTEILSQVCSSGSAALKEVANTEDSVDICPCHAARLVAFVLDIKSFPVYPCQQNIAFYMGGVQVSGPRQWSARMPR